MIPSQKMEFEHLLFQNSTLLQAIISLIHSGHFYSDPSSPLLLRGAPDYNTDTVSEFSRRSAQATTGKGLHSFIPAISIASLQVLHHSEALPTTARILYRSFTPKAHRQLQVKVMP